LSWTDASGPEPGRLQVDEPAPGVARVTISHAARRGALDHPILDAFAETLPRLDARCLIITGEEGMFSSGYDIGALSDEVFADAAEKLIAQPFDVALAALAEYPFPTIAALNGHAIGGGLELAVSCDLRIAADSARMGMPPAKLGLVYSHTGIRKFVDVIGGPRTRELFFTGALVDAPTALSWGLVNAVHPSTALAQAALELATTIASNAPRSMSGNKRVISAVLDGQAALAPAIERELLELRAASVASEDFREGVRAFGEKRAPRWQGR
jgi:enoyl-CoA hydratase/carnithine racemase